MVKLSQLLKQMDQYNWNPIILPNKLEKNPEMRFNNILKEARFILEGSVLDVCCGPLSLGVIYKKVVGYDIKPSFIKNLRKQGITGIIGDFRDMPFDDHSFDIATCIFPPLYPYSKTKLDTETNLNRNKLMHEITSEMIRVTRKKVLIYSSPHFNFRPNEYRKHIERQNDTYVIYNLSQKY